MGTSDKRAEVFEYDVALSFAGEQRGFAERVAEELRGRGIRPFYDDYEKAELWGKDLYEHLHYVYSKAARYCVMFVSSDYAKKVWTNLERQSAQERALQENREYVLPARFDSTQVPGLRETVGFVDATGLEPSDLAELIEAKVGPRQKSDFFPPKPDRLFEVLEATDELEAEFANNVAHQFFQAMGRMTPEERRVVGVVFTHGCAAELPENIHISLDLISRISGLPPAEIKRHLASIRALGFTSSVRPLSDIGDHELAPDDEMMVVSWSDLQDTPDEIYERGIEWETPIAYHAATLAHDGYCEVHGIEILERRDFSNLSSVTYSEEDENVDEEEGEAEALAA